MHRYTEDFFVHKLNRGPTSAMPPELLPTDAAAVMGKMKWATCALVGNSAVVGLYKLNPADP